MNTIIDSDDIKRQINDITKFFSSEQIEEIARLTGFVKRESKLTGTIFLSIFTLGMNLYQKPSLNQLLGLLKTVLPEVEITREGFHQRINEYAVNFFEFMLSQAINISVGKVDLKLLKNFKRVLILDSTIIELPKELTETFKGCGGNASESALKIQFCYDLKSGKFFYFFQDGISSDAKYENSFIDKIEPEDMIIKDMGYFNPQAFIELSNKGSYFLSRWKSNHDIFIKNEKGYLVSVDIATFLKKINSITEIEIYIKKNKLFCKARLVIEKVPEEVKNIRLRKLEKTSKKQGNQPKEMTKLFQSFNIYVSNVYDNLLSKESFRKLYGVRWQIELVFKNWKSNFGVYLISWTFFKRLDYNSIHQILQVYSILLKNVFFFYCKKPL